MTTDQSASGPKPPLFDYLELPRGGCCFPNLISPSDSFHTKRLGNSKQTLLPSGLVTQMGAGAGRNAALLL